MDQTQFEKMKKLALIFQPHAAQLRLDLHEKRKRVVHYTSAECALNIIRSKRELYT